MRKRTELNIFYSFIFIFSLLGLILFLLSDVIILREISRIVQNISACNLKIWELGNPIKIALETTLKILSLFVSIGITWGFFNVTSGIFAYYAYKVAARNLKVKRYKLTDAIIKNFEWELYRFGLTILPVVSVVAILLFIAIFSYVFFNAILFFASISIPLFSFWVVFIGLSALVGLFFVLPACAWNNIISFFGTEVAVSEPNLNNYSILKRSKRILFEKQFNIVLYSFYNSYILFFIYYLIQGAITGLRLSEIIPFIYLNLLIMVLLNYLKIHNYIDSTCKHLERITFEIDTTEEHFLMDN